MALFPEKPNGSAVMERETLEQLLTQFPDI
ncbi:hypothetical protein SAMN04515695_1788 [Pseudovibrio sp. Tun.PSC04-5.I4]|nr:hypothetical protein SAMN04515695_1788 [Pseudovibrio sp. Tun.PSC04-5.I4]